MASKMTCFIYDAEGKLLVHLPVAGASVATNLSTDQGYANVATSLRGSAARSGC